MKSLISKAVVKVLIPLFLFFSFYMLFRGHNEPGGGFIGGLIGTIVFTLYGMVYGPESRNKLLSFDPLRFIYVGLLLIIVSAVAGLFAGTSFMGALWADLYLPFFGKPGTPILFDIGIYLVVMGVVLKIAFAMLEE